MVNKILCVAEKPSIAKAVANHLARNVTSHRTAAKYNVNYEFDFQFSPPWGFCKVVMTSVAGHLVGSDFDGRYRDWNGCQPQELFDAPIVDLVDSDKKAIADNIERQARYCMGLFIWTDCDREGEYIGTEIRTVAFRGNPNLEVKRAKFSNIERNHVTHAAKNPVMLDERQAQAVSARIELDLRIGASFTRTLTKHLKGMILQVQELKIISYGSCQFPTLGFVVDRYFRVKNFQPEPFWKLQVWHERDGIKVEFRWKRNHLFDRMVTTIIFERCLAAKQATVTSIQQKPTSKWRPLPLTTVELQKMGSRFLHMDSQRVMQLAETLYQRGLISYPRTETDMFSRDMDLQAIIGQQTSDQDWGDFAQNLLDGGFQWPRNGRNNDQAHPPIHPVNHPTEQLEYEMKRVYEFVVRRFLACCSEDAKGSSTTVTLSYGPEVFTANGLEVLQRNYLDVYPYEKWTSTQQLPVFQQGERFLPDEAKMTEGKTTPPGYLTEPELIALMDANGIGTDATMAEHIAKIRERAYVITMSPTGGAIANGDSGRGGRGGRGRGGRGGRGGGGTARGGHSGGGGGNAIFIPTTLGVALYEGYENLGFETSLTKPFLRKEMELQMKAICEGTRTRGEVVQTNIDQFREVWVRTAQQMNVLKTAVSKYVLQQNQAQG